MRNTLKYSRVSASTLFRLFLSLSKRHELFSRFQARLQRLRKKLKKRLHIEKNIVLYIMLGDVLHRDEMNIYLQNVFAN